MQHILSRLMSIFRNYYYIYINAISSIKVAYQIDQRKNSNSYFTFFIIFFTDNIKARHWITEQYSKIINGETCKLSHFIWDQQRWICNIS